MWHYNCGLVIKTEAVKILGIILTLAGILMLMFSGFNYTKEKEVVDMGPVIINKKETKTVVWPRYAGVAALVAGVALLVFAKKTKDS